MSKQPKPSRLIGPEDVRVGQYVTIAHTTLQLICEPCGGDWRPDAEPTRVEILSPCAGWPMKVVAVSVPFVFTVDPDGDHLTVDLRRHRLARLGKRYGEAAFKSVDKTRRKRSKNG